MWCCDDRKESGVLVQGEVSHDAVEGNGPVRDDRSESGEGREQCGEGMPPLVDVLESHAVGQFPWDKVPADVLAACESGLDTGCSERGRGRARVVLAADRCVRCGDGLGGQATASGPGHG